jgi:hypothetical protein
LELSVLGIYIWSQMKKLSKKALILRRTIC